MRNRFFAVNAVFARDTPKMWPFGKSALQCALKTLLSNHTTPANAVTVSRTLWLD